MTREKTLIGFVGRFSPEKNPLAPVHAISNLPALYHAVLVGDVVNSRSAAWIRKEATRIAGERVTFVSSTDSVGDIYSALDVLILASPAEGCSLTIIESWIAGLPVVATPVGLIPEIEQRFGQMVYRVPPNPRPEELASAVLEAAERGRDSAVPLRAREVASEHLTANHMTETWASYLEEIVPRD